MALLRQPMEAIKLYLIMGREDSNLVTLVFNEIAELSLVAESGFAVHLHHPLVDAKPRGAVVLLRIHFAAKEISVASMEEPTLVGLDGDAAMAVGVPNQGNEENFWR